MCEQILVKNIATENLVYVNKATKDTFYEVSAIQWYTIAEHVCAVASYSRLLVFFLHIFIAICSSNIVLRGNNGSGIKRGTVLPTSQIIHSPWQWPLITIPQENHSFHPRFPIDDCRLVSIFPQKVRCRSNNV